MYLGICLAALASACCVLATPRVAGSLNGPRLALALALTAWSAWAFDLGLAEAVSAALGVVMLCLPLVSWAHAAFTARAAKRVQP